MKKLPQLCPEHGGEGVDYGLAASLGRRGLRWGRWGWPFALFAGGGWGGDGFGVLGGGEGIADLLRW